MTTTSLAVSSGGDNAARINSALSLYTNVILDAGEFDIEAGLVIPSGKNLCIAEGSSVVPLGNFDIVQQQGGSMLTGLGSIVAKNTSGWNKTAVLHNGNAEAGGDTINYRPKKLTVTQANVVGISTGTGNGVALEFRALANTDRVMGVQASITGEGFDDIVVMGSGANAANTFITDNIVKVPTWGSALRCLRMACDAADQGITGNTIVLDNQSRSLAEQTVSPLVLAGRRNTILHSLWDWTSAVPKRTDTVTNTDNIVIDLLDTPALSELANGNLRLKTLHSLLYSALTHEFRNTAGNYLGGFATDNNFWAQYGIALAVGAQLHLNSTPTTQGVGALKQIRIVLDNVNYYLDAKPV